MCGIAGKLCFRSDERVTAETVARMCGALHHRGPDDDGMYLDGVFGMGMRRLSIIDLLTGQQPIRNEDGSVWSVFNGEIYNYRELRSELLQQGHRFYTQADTEVIVHLYEEHGEAFAERLAGMFAIALWDRRGKKLMLVRDRLGIKPLYYSVSGERLVFASEIKALLEDNVSKAIDLQALHDYLSLNYVPGPRTIFTDIRKLQPGHIAVCSAAGVAVRRYWSLQYPGAAEASGRRSDESYCEELDALLRTTVAQHLISDVPVGIFLSGGVDSSSLVALAREVSSDRIQTFSIGFDVPSYDELAYSRMVAHRFETDHREMIVRPDVAELLPLLVRYFDEPFADSSAIPLFCVSKLARQHVKVTLSGEGGDEVFAGYQTYAAHKIAALYQRLPTMLSQRLIPAAVRRLPLSDRKVSFDYKAKRFVGGALLPPDQGHYWWKVILTEDAKATLYARRPEGLEDPFRFYRDAYQQCDATDILTRLQHIDISVYLPDDILVKADRMTMANSIEGRVPFLDHRIAEFAASLPPRLRMRGLAKKYILRRTMARRLPSRVLHGKKRGFNVPIGTWLRCELRQMVHEVLDTRALREMGLFRPDVVMQLVREHEERRLDHSRPIWGLVMFGLWWQQYGREAGGTCEHLTPQLATTTSA